MATTLGQNKEKGLQMNERIDASSNEIPEQALDAVRALVEEL
jgi:hypothetical protein